MKSNTQETAPCLNSYTQPAVECSRTQTGTSAVGQGKTSRQVSSYFLHFTILDQVNIFFQKSLYSQPNLNRLFRKKIIFVRIHHHRFLPQVLLILQNQWGWRISHYVAFQEHPLLTAVLCSPLWHRLRKIYTGAKNECRGNLGMYTDRHHYTRGTVLSE